MTGKVEWIAVSKQKGTSKIVVKEAFVNHLGIEGDAHAGIGHRQVSLLSMESVKRFTGTHGEIIEPGMFAENLLVSGVDLGKVAPLDTIVVGDVVLEVTQIGKQCHGEGCTVFKRVGTCIMPKEGIFARVRSGGPIREGEKVEILKRPLKIDIVTSSDRAHRGEYEDRSGPGIESILRNHFSGGRWQLDLNRMIVPDEKEEIRCALEKLKEEGTDIVIVTGGTGVGPRDVTPEAVRSVIDREIPGIMEMIRVKYGEKIPGALLSRSVAGIKGNTVIYAIPGSKKASAEYTTEILKTLEHLLLMMHGIGH